MVCKHCGYEIKEEDEFCGNCGKRVELIDDDMNPQNLNKNYHSPYEKHNNYQANNRVDVGKVVGIIMIVVAFFMRDFEYFFLQVILITIGVVLITQKYKKYEKYEKYDEKERNLGENIFNSFTGMTKLIGTLIITLIFVWIGIWIVIAIGMNITQHC